MSLLSIMSAELRIPTSFILKVAASASRKYKIFQIPKRSGGLRTIAHPEKGLKALQRWLVDRVIASWPVHEAASAYRPGRSTRDNAARHANSHYLLRMDLQNFFPSITESDIRVFLTIHAELVSSWTPVDHDLFARLTCRNGGLPIGAPSSPSISNALCFVLDSELDALARRDGATYTRYADDLFFSVSQPGILRHVEEQVPQVLASLRVPGTLTINPGKTRHSSRRGRRRVTGITLGSDAKLHVGRPIKRLIRAKIHRYEGLTAKERASLTGLVAYVQSIDPDFVNSLIMKYGSVRVSEVRGFHAAGR